jgi:putative MFS transporter
MPLEVSLRYSLITSIFGIVGGLTCAFLVDIVGRRMLFSFSFLWAALALLGLWLIGPSSAEIVLVGVTAAYIGITVLSNGLYLYTPELYPTRVRALAVSTATAWLRLASIIGPVTVGYIVARGDISSVFLALSIVAGVGGLIAFAFGVETKSKLLEEVSP